MRLCSAKPRRPFSPLTLWSSEGTEGLGCLWLPGPCCFAGGLLSLNPTPNVFHFVEIQELAGKCLLRWPQQTHGASLVGQRKFLLDACPRNQPGASYGTQDRGPISPTAQNLLRELHSGKVDSPRGTNHSPNAPLLSKAMLAFFSPSPLVSRGQCGAWLPLAPWALLLCWWSSEVETHTKCVLLRGEAGLGRKMPSGRSSSNPPRAS